MNLQLFNFSLPGNTYSTFIRQFFLQISTNVSSILLFAIEMQLAPTWMEHTIVAVMMGSTEMDSIVQVIIQQLEINII